MFIGTWSDIYMHKSVHVHTHLDSPRNSHMTQGQRRTVTVLFTLTQATLDIHHTRHPRHTPIRHPAPRTNILMSTAQAHIQCPRQRELLRFLLRYVHPQTKTYTHQRHTVSTTARRLTGATQSQAVHSHTSRQTWRDSTAPHRVPPILPHKHRCVYTLRHQHTCNVC